jgi:hypothetical protein
MQTQFCEFYLRNMMNIMSHFNNILAMVFSFMIMVRCPHRATKWKSDFNPIRHAFDLLQKSMPFLHGRQCCSVLNFEKSTTKLMHYKQRILAQ